MCHPSHSVQGSGSFQRTFHFALSVADLPGFNGPSDSVFPPQPKSSSRALPSIFISATALMFSVSFLLFICQNRSNFLLFIIIAIGSTFSSYFNYLYVEFIYKSMNNYGCYVTIWPITMENIILAAIHAPFGGQRIVTTSGGLRIDSQKPIWYQ